MRFCRTNGDCDFQDRCEGPVTTINHAHLQILVSSADGNKNI